MITDNVASSLVCPYTKVEDSVIPANVSFCIPIEPPLTTAARARSCCSFIAALKPLWSILYPASSANSSVNSTGKP